MCSCHFVPKVESVFRAIFFFVCLWPALLKYMKLWSFQFMIRIKSLNIVVTLTLLHLWASDLRTSTDDQWFVKPTKPIFLCVKISDQPTSCHSASLVWRLTWLNWNETRDFFQYKGQILGCHLGKWKQQHYFHVK